MTIFQTISTEEISVKSPPSPFQTHISEHQTMNEFPSPFSQPSSHPAKSSLPMLYYGLVVVGTAAIVLVMYNLIIIRWCADRHGRSPEMLGSSRSFESMNRNLLSSFRFKKGEEEGYEQECVVCLSAFEEGEEVRKLPRCGHMFHVQCIDMWLYSHFDCPLCRAPVGSALCQSHSMAAQDENSREGLLDNGDSV